MSAAEPTADLRAAAILRRFENLALQYDSDEIGELEEDDERLQGDDLFPAHDRLLQQLLARHRDDDPAENSLPYEAAADVRHQEGEEAAEAAAAITKVRPPPYVQGDMPGAS